MVGDKKNESNKIDDEKDNKKPEMPKDKDNLIPNTGINKDINNNDDLDADL